MAKRLLNTVGTIGLCALLLAECDSSKYSQTGKISFDDIKKSIGPYPIRPRDISSYDVESLRNPMLEQLSTQLLFPSEPDSVSDKKIEINSVLNLIANPHGDPITLNNIRDAFKNIPYHAEWANHSVNSDNLIDAYLNSKSELLVICGHHTEGTSTVFDYHADEHFALGRLNPKDSTPNPYIKVAILRMCHGVMNPVFLEQENRKHPCTRYTSDAFIDTLLKFAPNLELIIGYETKSPFTDDYALIDVMKHISILEKEGTVAYRKYIIGLNERIADNPGHDRDASGKWTYNTYYDPNSNEGMRMACIAIQKNGLRKYYSRDYRNGIYTTVRPKIMKKE